MPVAGGITGFAPGRGDDADADPEIQLPVPIGKVQTGLPDVN